MHMQQLDSQVAKDLQVVIQDHRDLLDLLVA